MTKDIDTLEFDEENSIGGSTSSGSEDFLIGSKIKEEEERLLIENEKIEAAVEASFTEESMLEDMKENIKTAEELAKKQENEMKERRYKRLMHLLNSSKMYSLLLKNKIEEDGSNARKKDASGSSQESSTQSKKKTSKQYKLGDVISEQQIEQSVFGSQEINPHLMDETEDYFKETRVTDLGFTVSYKQPLLLEGGTMRDYQLKGLEWMKVLFFNGVNGILADEMGLGKTIQVISFICYMIEQNIAGPFLIVAPLSTVSNWMAEFKKFAPKVPTMLYHGTEEERRAMSSKILQKKKVMKKAVHSVVITSYQVPLRDKAILGSINWYYLIIDEGHRIKNHNSMLSRTLRPFNTIGRLLLTGTPLQNDLPELWSLLNFLLPEVFNTLDVFQSWFDIKDLESNGTRFIEQKFNIDVVTILQEILVPFLLRREKKDVNLQLPPKKEVLIYCPLTPRQKELYQATIDRSIALLVKPNKDVTDIGQPLPKRRCFMNSPYGKKDLKDQNHDLIPKSDSPREEEDRYVTKVVLQNPQIQLRKIVNHPYLIQFPLKTGTEELRIDEELVSQSGKLLVLDAMLAKLKDRGHKVIVFSYFKILLDILEDHAIIRGYKYSRLDGSSNINDRDAEIAKFVTNPDIFLFYISIRAGGLGINLTAADTVIFYDSDWNPQVNLQSQDRCHRIGQTKPVMIYRFCAKGTIDERIIERGNAKRRLEKMILQKGKFALNSKIPKNLNLMDLQELKTLMESTDHDIEINSNGYVFTDEELEALLDRSDLTDEKLMESDTGNKVFKVLNYEKC